MVKMVPTVKMVPMVKMVQMGLTAKTEAMVKVSHLQA